MSKRAETEAALWRERFHDAKEGCPRFKNKEMWANISDHRGIAFCIDRGTVHHALAGGVSDETLAAFGRWLFLNFKKHGEDLAGEVRTTHHHE